jgi:hypothetical protein
MDDMMNMAIIQRIAATQATAEPFSKDFIGEKAVYGRR